jgi:hypothetical protein
MKIQFYTALLVVLPGFYACADESTMPLSKTNRPDDTAASYPGKLGVGVIVGEPTGASVKYWLNDTLAVDGAAGWSVHDNTDFYVHGDLLWHDFDQIPVSSGRLPFYIGVGGLVRFRDDNNLDNEVGIRVPVGVSYMFENAPLDIFVEIGPALDIAPDVRGEITGGIGVRYWF